MEESVTEEFEKFFDLYLSLADYLAKLDHFQIKRITHVLPYVKTALSHVNYLNDCLSVINSDKKPSLPPQNKESNTSNENWRQFIQVSKKISGMHEKNPSSLMEAWSEFSELKSLLTELVRQLEATKDRTGLYPGDIGYVSPIES